MRRLVCRGVPCGLLKRAPEMVGAASGATHAAKDIVTANAAAIGVGALRELLELVDLLVPPDSPLITQHQNS